MPLGFGARLRCRRAAVMIAAALIAMQAFFAGLATAEAALVLTPDLTDVAVICHSNGGADPGGAAPDPIKARHLCCLSCTAGAPPVTLPTPSIALRSERGRTFKSPQYFAATLLVAPRPVRAGLSQAPPSRA